jgi:hypothetical protein
MVTSYATSSLVEYALWALSQRSSFEGKCAQALETFYGVLVIPF